MARYSIDHTHHSSDHTHQRCSPLPCHQVELIQMRRRVAGEHRVFKGSVFVEFRSKEEADCFLAWPDVEFRGVKLVKESK